MELEHKARQAADLLKLLANEHRLLVLCALTDGARTVSQLHEHMPNISASALSQHLALMKAAGLLACDKQGLHVFYRIQDDRALALLRTLREQFCPD